MLPLVYAALHISYSGLCFWFEPRAPQKETERHASAEAARQEQWDVVKFVMLVLVIFLHVGREGFMDGQLTQTEQIAFLMVSAFPMPCFAFISGIFGAGCVGGAMVKMLCCTLGTFMLAKLLLACVMLLTPGPKDLGHLAQEGDWVLWYLQCLPVWRLSIAPLFHVSGRLGLQPALPFMLVCGTSYLLRYWPWSPPLGWPRDCVFFAPFYAQGLLLTPTRWLRLLDSPGLTAAGALFLTAWCAGLVSAPGFRRWNDVACSLGQRQCASSHWPNSVTWAPSALSLDSLRSDLRVYVLMDGLMLSVMWAVAALAKPLRVQSPQLSQLLGRCGARTLYGYVLHEVFILVLGMRMGVRLPAMPSWLWIGVSLVVALQGTFVWCSSLTQVLFEWAIKPVWIKNQAGSFMKAAR